MATASDAQKLKVFISYSRADAAFADELVAGLEFARQFDVTIDRHSIVEGEDWKKRLGALIADADTIVFLLTPDSAKSDICGWEVEEAWRLSKRILPVLVRAIGSLPAPPRLAALNYVRFDEGRSFMAGLNGLVRALNTDVDWLREHTRLLARALEWSSANRAANRLLSGADIDAAKAWLARRPKDAPEATELHLAFIRASEQAETDRTSAERKRLEEMAAAQAASAQALAEREVAVKALSRRTTVGLVSAGGLTVAAGGLAWWGNDAERRFGEAQEKAVKAEVERIDREAMRTDIVGQLTAFAASPGQDAMDGPVGGNSPYTLAMIEELANEHASFQAALARATRKVIRYAAISQDVAPHLRQSPFMSTDLNGDIYLYRKPATRRLKALVISTSAVVNSHENYTLANTERDAVAWERLLVRAGFGVERLLNPTTAQCHAAIERLKFEPPGQVDESPPAQGMVPRKQGGLDSLLLHRVGISTRPATLTPNALLLVFYAGIGFVIDGDNFIGTKDTRALQAASLQETAVSLTALQETLRDRAAASILVMDTNFNRIRVRDPALAIPPDQNR